MHNPSENNHTTPTAELDPVVSTIIRGEDVLDEARALARKISGRVNRAVTERPPPEGPRQDRQ